MINTMNDNIRTAFRKRMKELNLTQEDIGATLGAPQSSISRVLTGKSGKIPELIERMADHLGLEVTAVAKTPKEGNHGAK